MISWLVLVLILFILSLTLLGATYFSRQAKARALKLRRTQEAEELEKAAWLMNW